MPEKVEVLTDHVKILWDFNIQTDHVTEHRRTDVVVLDKHDKMCHLIDIAVPGDSRVASKENIDISGFSERTPQVVASQRQSEDCSCGSGSTGYNPVGIGETSQGDRNIC